MLSAQVLLVCFVIEAGINLSQFDIRIIEPMVVTNDGEVIVLDTHQKQLLKFSQKGELLWRAGRSGEGPQEFQNPLSIAYHPIENTIWVQDFPSRFSIWRANGKHMRNVSFTKPYMSPAFSKSGHMFMVANPYGGALPPQIIQVEPENKTETVVWTYKGETKENKIDADGWKLNLSFEWDPALVFGVGQNHLAMSFNDTTVVHFGNPSGKSFVSKNVHLKRPEFDKSDMDAAISNHPDFLRDAIKKHQPLPEYWPAVKRLIVSDEQDVWVFSHLNSEGKATFEVIDAHGDLKKRGETDLIPNAIQGNKAFGLKVGDDDDVKLIIRSLD